MNTNNMTDSKMYKIINTELVKWPPDEHWTDNMTPKWCLHHLSWDFPSNFVPLSDWVTFHMIKLFFFPFLLLSCVNNEEVLEGKNPLDTLPLTYLLTFLFLCHHSSQEENCVCSHFPLHPKTHTHTRAHRVSLAFQASALLNFKGNILWTSHWQKPTANQLLSLALPDKHALQSCQATTLNNNSSVTSSDCHEEGPQLSSQPAHDATIVSQVNELHQVVMYRYKVADTGNQTQDSFICT